MPLKPELLKGFQQSPFIGRVREGHGYLLPTSWCQILCSYSCPHRSGHSPVTMFLFFSGQVMVRLSYLFQAIGNNLLQKVQSMTQHRQHVSEQPLMSDL